MMKIDENFVEGHYVTIVFAVPGFATHREI